MNEDRRMKIADVNDAFRGRLLMTHDILASDRPDRGRPILRHRCQEGWWGQANGVLAKLRAEKRGKPKPQIFPA